MLPDKYRWLWLLIASYFFYMCWRADFALLLMLSTTIDYLSARGMEKYPPYAKALLTLSITANLGILLFFKYAHFLHTNLQTLFSWAGLPTTSAEGWDILLPVGISFYTFQALSYTIDVYRKIIPAEKHFGIFALYLVFFPQLVAGPIERSGYLLPQFREYHQWEWKRTINGLQWILWGLFKKMVIADNVALLITPIYQSPDRYAWWMIIGAFYGFTIQIYGDFSGYCDIAKGSAMVLGFRLSDNFRTPYFSRSFPELWRRWHITLGIWIRDYLFLPLKEFLGGGVYAHYIALFIAFLTTGIWHGAGWNFVVFGVFTGLVVIGYVSTATIRAQLSNGLPPVLKKTLPLVEVLVTYHFWSFSALLFRAVSIEKAGDMGRQLLLLNKGASLGEQMAHFQLTSLGVVAISWWGLLVLEYLSPPSAEHPFVPIGYRPIRWMVYYGLLIMIILLSGDNQPFYYFRF